MIGYQALHATAKFLHHDKVLLRSNYWFIFLGCTPVHLMLFFCILNWCHSSRILSFLFTAAVQGRRRSARLHRNSNLLSTNQTRANSACAEDNPSNLPIITNPFQMKNETPHSPASPAAFLPPHKAISILKAHLRPATLLTIRCHMSPITTIPIIPLTPNFPWKLLR